MTNLFEDMRCNPALTSARNRNGGQRFVTIDSPSPSEQLSALIKSHTGKTASDLVQSIRRPLLRTPRAAYELATERRLLSVSAPLRRAPIGRIPTEPKIKIARPPVKIGTTRTGGSAAVGPPL